MLEFSILCWTHFACHLSACLNEANMLVEHHPTLLDTTSWPRLNTMLDDVR